MIPEKLKILKLSNATINFHCVSGEIIESKTWSETDISSGTQTNLTNNTQWISNIQSNKSEITELFIRTPEGKEISERLYNSGSSLRNGNEVSIVYANNTPICLYNKTIEKYWRFNMQRYYTASASFFARLSFGGAAILGGIAGWISLVPFSFLYDFFNLEISFIPCLNLIWITPGLFMYLRYKKLSDFNSNTNINKARLVQRLDRIIEAC